MKLGTENRKQVIVASVLGVIALCVMAFEFWPSSSAPSTASATSGAPGATRPVMHRNAAGKMVPVTEPRLDPTLDLKLLAQSEGIKYAGNGRNIFVAGSVATIEQPKRRGVTDPKPVFTPPPVPGPPPITLKFFGFANKPGEPRRVFLSQGEDVFIAGEGDIVNRRYRVLHIQPNAVEMEDVINNNRQSIPLTQG